MNGEKFNSDKAPQAVGMYPHARKVGGLLFLSGVGPREKGKKEIPLLIKKSNENSTKNEILTLLNMIDKTYSKDSWKPPMKKILDLST